MTNASKPLVPITREFLRQFYQKYPLDPVPHETRTVLLQRIEELADAVKQPGSKVPEQVGMPTPTRIDDCFWRNRMICEELAFSLSQLQAGFSGEPELAAACARCHGILGSAERIIFSVQEHNASSVKEQLKQFIPQDFRGALLESKRVSTEARYKKQVEELVRRGGTIRQKYDLYLQQQWERRQALVQLGECSGMYKMVIKWVAGIPQVLLDFAKEINAKLGPMEEQRIKYGPDLYGITELGIRLNVCLAAWAEGTAAAAAATTAAAAAAAAAPRVADVVEPAILFYCEQMLRVIQHIGNVFQHSPFFVNRDDLAAGGGGGGQEGKAAEKGGNPELGQPDAECGSSNLSAASASGDYTAAPCVAPAALSTMPSAPPQPPTPAPSVPAPSTPGLAPPRGATPLLTESSGSGTAFGGCSGEVASSDAAAAAAVAAAGTADTIGIAAAACSSPEKQQLTSRFADAKTNAAVAAMCLSDRSPLAAAAALHHLPTPTPHALQARLGQPLDAGRASPHAGGLRLHLSAESHVSFLSALEHQPWLVPEEEVEEGPGAVSVLDVEEEGGGRAQLSSPHQSQHQQSGTTTAAVASDVGGKGGGAAATGGSARVLEHSHALDNAHATGSPASADESCSSNINSKARRNSNTGQSAWSGCFQGCFGRKPSKGGGGQQRQTAASIGGGPGLLARGGGGGNLQAIEE